MSESFSLSGNLGREFATICAMVAIYCRDHHGCKTPCGECQAFMEYAKTRLDRCPYGQEKPTCNKCPVHCYKPEPRELARQIMRYAGPRMLLPHPIMAIRHLLLERKPAPDKPPKNLSNRHLRLQKATSE
ncbi:nitrous oxide-stimulated promoter family protein [Shewanella zhangzhouensis]|uniref:nitrous oxide-stimulated promoter family protein n=1 Tax=Shewanella zhangzhouensis TaxID=2864213 RepID=UPI001C656406|nr:nitrous oxide-stimulated promoter family protein [Shewanella zhangzhouensis]QYK04953.1 nitrous oxide-stimulated promoter family protein [Shewanella zhangzhouensis]